MHSERTPEDHDKMVRQAEEIIAKEERTKRVLGREVFSNSQSLLQYHRAQAAIKRAWPTDSKLT